MPKERMAAILAANPSIGRHELARLAGTTENVARGFLAKHRKEKPEPPPPIGNHYDFLSHLSEAEISALRRSITSAPQKQVFKPHSWASSSFKFAIVADTHFGHSKASAEWWDKTCDLIGRERCQVVFHVGDITEGMSGRAGQVYELEAVGVTAQINLAAARLEQLPCPVEGITGNHDAWAFKAVGVDVGEVLETKLPGKYKHLGADEADVEINGITIKLWHGGDGASYATSYRTQKFVEGLSGGEKPHILLSGHAHKSLFHCCRNVMVFECGTLCGQTSWMRGKKLAAHTGFWIVEVWPSVEGGIERIKPEWIPLFM